MCMSDVTGSLLASSTALLLHPMESVVVRPYSRVEDMAY